VQTKLAAKSKVNDRRQLHSLVFVQSCHVTVGILDARDCLSDRGHRGHLELLLPLHIVNACNSHGRRHHGSAEDSDRRLVDRILDVLFLPRRESRARETPS